MCVGVRVYVTVSADMSVCINVGVSVCASLAVSVDKRMGIIVGPGARPNLFTVVSRRVSVARSTTVNVRGCGIEGRCEIKCLCTCGLTC